VFRFVRNNLPVFVTCVRRRKTVSQSENQSKFTKSEEDQLSVYDEIIDLDQEPCGNPYEAPLYDVRSFYDELRNATYDHPDAVTGSSAYTSGPYQDLNVATRKSVAPDYLELIGDDEKSTHDYLELIGENEIKAHGYLEFLDGDEQKEETLIGDSKIKADNYLELLGGDEDKNEALIVDKEIKADNYLELLDGDEQKSETLIGDNEIQSDNYLELLDGDEEKNETHEC